jgi:hypothetical protein
VYSAPAGGNEHGGDELSLERPLGTNKDGLALGEALYWTAEKLTWGFEDVEPDPAEELILFRQSAESLERIKTWRSEKSPRPTRRGQRAAASR